MNGVPPLIYKTLIIYKLTPFKCSLYIEFTHTKGFPGGSNSKESVCNARDMGLIPKSGRSPGEGNGNLLSYFCLKSHGQEEPGGLQSMGSQSQT